MGIFGKSEKDSVATIELKPSEVVPNEAAKRPANTAQYTVQDAIVLMRQLPADANSLPLVVQVVRSTLASLNVKVEDIVEDAKVRERNLEERVLKIRAEISELEKEISARRQQITDLESDLGETVSVRERLEISDGASASRLAAASTGALPKRVPGTTGGPAAPVSTPSVIVGTGNPAKSSRS